jgi:hypothetical protein
MNVSIEAMQYADVTVDPQVASEMIAELLKAGPLPSSLEALRDALPEQVERDRRGWLDGCPVEVAVAVDVDDDEWAAIVREHTDPEVLAKRQIPGQLTLDGEEVA